MKKLGNYLNPAINFQSPKKNDVNTVVRSENTQPKEEKEASICKKRSKVKNNILANEKRCKSILRPSYTNGLLIREKVPNEEQNLSEIEDLFEEKLIETIPENEDLSYKNTKSDIKQPRVLREDTPIALEEITEELKETIETKEEASEEEPSKQNLCNKITLSGETPFPHYVGFYFRDYYNSLVKIVREKEGILDTGVRKRSLMASFKLPESTQIVKNPNKTEFNGQSTINLKKKNCKSFITMGYEKAEQIEFIPNPSFKGKFPKNNEEELKKINEHVIHSVQLLKAFNEKELPKQMLMLGNHEICQKNPGDKLLAIFDMDETLIHTAKFCEGTEDIIDDDFKYDK